MVWSFTKHNHEWSTSRIVRWWLRTGLIVRFLITLVLSALLFAGAQLLISGTTPTSFGLGGRPTSPWGFAQYIGPALLVLFFLDAIWDNFSVNMDLANYHGRNDVALATRAEYIGGHPELPHGRFLYLLLEGGKENPLATILVPQDNFYAPRDSLFSMPILEVDRRKTEQHKIIHHKQLLGYDLRLIIEYNGEAGRKHEVELGHFFRGNDEIQLWKNYIVCLQAEADTGKRPFGEWKTLPSLPGAKSASAPRFA